MNLIMYIRCVHGGHNITPLRTCAQNILFFVQSSNYSQLAAHFLMCSRASSERDKLSSVASYTLDVKFKASHMNC